MVWLSYGVHGNEISSPDAALLTAYHLLAARQDPVVANVLANTVVLIDPLQNPDGRQRFLHGFEQAEGLEPDAYPLAAEHQEPWPSGRVNHYLIDLNRDWIGATQPEIRGQIRVLEQWYPLVYVDLHEMGRDATYFFSPEAVPYNPHLARDQVDDLALFGRNNARWFDQFGFAYFTREIFDAFYPGYGASWPSYYGSIAMTYEQASARGLRMERSDDSVLTFAETVRHHFVASVSTCETAAVNRQKLLEHFYRYRQSAIEEGGREPVREYILSRAGDTATVDKLADLLVLHGIRVNQARAAFEHGGRKYPAGSYLVPLAQPAKRFIRTLLDPEVAMEKRFLEEQERRRKKNLPGEIYDVTAWSLPLLFNVEFTASAEPVKVASTPVARDAVRPGRVTGEKARLAYLAPWGTAAAGRLLAASLRQGLNVWSSDKAFRQGERRYPAGTLIYRVHENPAGLAEALAKLAQSTGAELVAVDSGWVDEGPNFGSEYVVRMRRPAVAMAWDRPVYPGSAGAVRFILERQFGYPVTAVRTSTLAVADLSRFQVLILPEGGAAYAGALGPDGIRRLKDWVAGGGTLIGLGSTVGFLADPKVGLLAVAQENLARPKDEKPKPETKPEPDNRVPGTLLKTEEDLEKAIQPERALPDAVHGVLVRARTDPDHWLAAGAAPTVQVPLSGSAIYSPIRQDKGVNAATFAGPDQLLAAGFLWEPNRAQLAYKPFVVVQPEGRGTVIGFTADPSFRAMADGLNVLLLNAVFRGPAHALPMRGAFE